MGIWVELWVVFGVLCFVSFVFFPLLLFLVVLWVEMKMKMKIKIKVIYFLGD